MEKTQANGEGKHNHVDEEGGNAKLGMMNTKPNGDGECRLGDDEDFLV